MGLGQTSLAPASAPGPTLGGWSWPSVPGAYWAAHQRVVQNDPVSPFNAAWQQQIVNFLGAGTGLKTGHYGTEPDATGSALGNTAVGNPVNFVAGSQATVAVATTGTCWGVDYTAFSDAGNVPVTQGMAIEGWPFGSSNGDNRIAGTVQVTQGSANVTGTGTDFTTWLAAGDQVCFSDGLQRPNVFYNVQTITDATHLTLSTNYGETSHSGWELYGPFNRPPTCAQLGLLSGDVRALILVRNESTLQPDHLWELYGGPSYDAGTGWRTAGKFLFNLTTGAQRPDGYTGSCTGGTPCLPFILRYEEPASGTVSHPGRGVIESDLCLKNQCNYPCTHAAAAFGLNDYTAGFIPTGAVLRLNAAWLAANRPSFSAINQAILDSWNKYGLHVNDYTHGQGVAITVDVSQDSRWKKADLQALWAVPATAWEVVDSIKPQFTLGISAAPYSSGSPITFTIAYVGDTQYSNANTNFSGTIHVEYSTDAGLTWHDTGASVALSQSTRSGTCTFTPSSTGNYLFSMYQASGLYWLPGVVTATQYNGGGTAVTSQAGIWLSANVGASARTLTTVADGRWDNPATWGNVAPPAAGDKATVAHNVMVIGDAVIGDGTASTVLTVASGSLTVIGCTFTVRGNATIGQANSGTVVNRLTVLNSAGNVASFLLDGNSGVTPVVSVASDTQLTFTGYSGQLAVCRTKSGTAGNPGYFNGTGTTDCFHLAASYTAFSHLGGATQAGLTAGHAGNNLVSPANPPFTMDHCTIDNCGKFPVLGIFGGADNVRITNTTWTNCLDSSSSPPIACQFSDDASAITSGGARLMDGCVFFVGQPYWGTQGSWTVTHNYFDQNIQGNTGQPGWVSFDGNFVRVQVNLEVSPGGSMTNSFFLVDGLTQFSGFLANRATASTSYSGNIVQATAMTDDTGSRLFMTSEAGSVTRTFTYTNNISLKSDAGDVSSGSILYDADTIGDSFDKYSDYRHNTQYIGNAPGMVCGATGHPVFTHHLLNFKDNIFWSDTTSGHAGHAIDNGADSGSIQADPVAPANCDYNGTFNVATVAGGTWASPNNFGNGTVYNIPLSAAPGVHDVSGTPNFVDSTRRLQTWSTAQGGAGTVADALARIQANPALTKSSLIPHIRAGFTPTTSAYVNSASDGTNRGAV